ncbi:pyridoxal-phosphate dependent enzyme [Streptomyces sp. L7]
MSDPRVELATFPTPVEPAPRLATAIGLGPDDLWIKRDDLTGLGGGGNKIRKLEWTVGAALAEGADTLVTTGAPQSNHARLTAAAGARLGLAVVLVLRGSPGVPRSVETSPSTGCSAPASLWAGEVDQAGLDRAAAEVCEQLRKGCPARTDPVRAVPAHSARAATRCGEELRGQAPRSPYRRGRARLRRHDRRGWCSRSGAEAVLGVDVGALPEPAAAASEFAALPTTEGLRIRTTRSAPATPRSPRRPPKRSPWPPVPPGAVLDPTYTGRAHGRSDRGRPGR